jgi:hypothetical protein
MNTADLWLTRIVGALLIFIGLAGLIMTVAGNGGTVSAYRLFDVIVPVLFILAGSWLFRLAARGRLITWSYGLGILLVFLGLAAAVLTLDEIMGEPPTGGPFGFLMGLILLAGGIILIRRATTPRSAS